MWLCFNNSFISVVHKAPCRADEVLVRARVRAHITTLFPAARIQRNESSDYLFRAVVKRTALAELLAKQVAGLDYPNFKNTVRNKPLHDAYMAIWNIMAKLQEVAPYSGAFRRRGTRPLFGRHELPELPGQDDDLPPPRRRRAGEMTDAEYRDYERSMEGGR